MSFTTLREAPSCENLDASSFQEQFGKPNLPFLLKNGVKNTFAMENWNWEYFRNKFGSREMLVYRTGNRNDFKKILFADYIDYIHHTQDEKPYYLLDWFVDNNCPELRQEYAVPAFFKSWTDHLPQALRPQFLAFYIGPKNSASPLHIDILSTSAWNAVFTGQKLWTFYPPDQKDLVYNGKVNPFKPDYDRFPLFKKAKGYYVVQNPGDIMFTPSNWWHAVHNTENTISLTDNFINNSNFKIFITHFFPALSHLVKRTWIRRHQQYNR